MDTNDGLPGMPAVGRSRAINGFSNIGHVQDRVPVQTGLASPPSSGSPSSDAVPAPAARPIFDEKLPRNQFLSQLDREKRRSERSKAPLSVIVCRFGEAGAANTAETYRLLDALQLVKRETDILGLLGDGAVAVLCPDTGEGGVAGFMRKLKARPEALGVDIVSATYPDLLFEHLADEAKRAPRHEPLITRDSLVGEQDEYRLKRALDIVGAIVSLCLFGPLMLVVAVLIAATSRGPIIFEQKRLGRGGVPFTFYKFRSMTTGVDDDIHRAFVASLIRTAGAEPATGTVPQHYKLQSDPRITRVGSFMRKSSIDELPQLFNVLKGDMSLVGPRPAIPYETAHYQSWHLRRILTVRPGMTGLWQVQGRSKVNFNDMVRMDIRYIKECSLWLDVKILLKTALVVLRLSESS